MRVPDDNLKRFSELSVLSVANQITDNITLAHMKRHMETITRKKIADTKKKLGSVKAKKIPLQAPF